MTSAPYTYQPGSGELVLNAYSRLKIRSTALLAEHMFAARQEMNLMLVEWANKGPNLWKVDQLSIPLLPGVSTYEIDSTTIAVLDVWLSPGGAAVLTNDENYPLIPAPLTNPPEVFQPANYPLTQNTSSFSGDRIMLPISRSEYASYPNKFQPGVPSVYWFDRLVSPRLTIWPVPYPNFQGNLNLFRWGQTIAAGTSGGQSLDIPWRFLDAATAGLSHRLSRHYAPEMEQQRKMDAMEAFKTAADQDTEHVPMYVSPMLGTYYR